MFRYVFLWSLFASSPIAEGLQFATFDSASASSTHSADNVAGSPAFAAQQATTVGSGYWCSGGGTEQSVTWTGVLNARRKALGVKINWAYAPGEMKVLASADGANFREVQCWRSNARSEVSYEESVMFDSPENVKSITVVMRSALSWKYFGITDIVLIAEPGPFMLTSGLTSASEQCLVVEGGAVVLSSCLDAIAAGDGREVFELSDDGQLLNAVSQECVTLLDGSTAGGGKVVMQKCAASVEAGDGRVVFEMQPNAQIQMPRLGDFCLTVAGDAGSERDLTMGADVSATSSQTGHSVINAVDGDESSYWASSFDAAENAPIDVQIDFGSTQRISGVEISWEYPAKGFELQVANGGAWSSVFSTSNNNLNLTSITGRSSSGNMLRIRMREPHPIWGGFDGHALYGIKSIRVATSSARTIVRDCTEAKENTDARDKFFMAAVPEFDPMAVVSVRASAALLVAAEQHLGSLLARLHATIPSLSACSAAGALFCERVSRVAQRSSKPTKACTPMSNADFLADARATAVGGVLTLSANDPVSSAIEAIGKHLSIDSRLLPALIRESRRTSKSLLATVAQFGLARLSDAIPDF